MTTRPYVFPGSLRESTGSGPDFPGSSGDRERGKFRESETPRLVTLAVVDDDGRPVAKTSEQLLEELLLWQKATVLAVSLLLDVSVDQIVSEANRL